MQFFLSVVEWQHVLVGSEKLVVSALEILDKMELVVFSCEEGNEVSLYLG